MKGYITEIDFNNLPVRANRFIFLNHSRNVPVKKLNSPNITIYYTINEYHRRLPSPPLELFFAPPPHEVVSSYG